jgi:hypothetical protein
VEKGEIVVGKENIEVREQIGEDIKEEMKDGKTMGVG